MHSGDGNDIDVCVERFRACVGLFRRNTRQVMRYEDISYSMYGHIMSQCMSYHTSKTFVVRMLSKFTLSLLDKILDDDCDAKALDNATIHAFLTGEMEYDKFIKYISGGDNVRSGNENL